VILPPARKAHGRLKGICQTVIGIPKKIKADNIKTYSVYEEGTY